jgi:hypothetical protein
MAYKIGVEGINLRQEKGHHISNLLDWWDEFDKTISGSFIDIFENEDWNEIKNEDTLIHELLLGIDTRLNEDHVILLNYIVLKELNDLKLTSDQYDQHDKERDFGYGLRLLSQSLERGTGEFLNKSMLGYVNDFNNVVEKGARIAEIYPNGSDSIQYRVNLEAKTVEPMRRIY